MSAALAARNSTVSAASFDDARLSPDNVNGRVIMGIKTTPTYSEAEISRIVKESEGVGAREGEGASGHSEGLHELQAVGKKRAHTSMAALRREDSW
jgi:hypothetical protein